MHDNFYAYSKSFEIEVCTFLRGISNIKILILKFHSTTTNNFTGNLQKYFSSNKKTSCKHLVIITFNRIIKSDVNCVHILQY